MAVSDARVALRERPAGRRAAHRHRRRRALRTVGHVRGHRVDGIDRMVVDAGKGEGIRTRPVLPRDPAGRVREDRLPRVVPRPHRLDPHLPGDDKDHAALLAAQADGRGLVDEPQARRGRPASPRRATRSIRRPHGDAARGRPQLRRARLLLPARAQPSNRPACRRSACTSTCCIGYSAGRLRHREEWVGRGLEVLDRAGTQGRGRGRERPVLRAGRPHAGKANQRNGALKMELVIDALRRR